MTVLLEHGGRRFQVVAYHDAIRHDGPALELAELVNDELGPALVTILFADSSAGEADVLLADCSLPRQILTGSWRKAFKKNVVYAGQARLGSEETTQGRWRSCSARSRSDERAVLGSCVDDHAGE